MHIQCQTLALLITKSEWGFIMKKLLSLIFVIILVSTMLVGCAEKAASPTEAIATETATEPTQAQTDAPTEKPTQLPTQAPTKAKQKPTQASVEKAVDRRAGMYISDVEYSSMDVANYIQLNEDRTVVMQINLFEAMLQVTGTYSGNENEIITFSEMVDSRGNTVICEGAEFHEYVDGLMLVYGVEDRFVLQGWNTPPAFMDGGFFRSPDSPDFDKIHS